MYVNPDYKTKKALKLAVAVGDIVTVYQPNNLFNVEPPTDEVATVEGPHSPKPHIWYAQVTIENGKIIKVE